jgi:hypothetical protein
MRWIEMLRTEVRPGEERYLIRSVQALLQAGIEAPVVAVMFWHHATLTTNFCVIIHCEDSSEEEVTQIRSHLGHAVSEMMRSSGLVSADVWCEL